MLRQTKKRRAAGVGKFQQQMIKCVQQTFIWLGVSDEDKSFVLTVQRQQTKFIQSICHYKRKSLALSWAFRQMLKKQVN